MKKIISFVLSLWVAHPGFATMLILDNEIQAIARYPRIAIQWADTGKEVEEKNLRIKQGFQITQEKSQVVTQTGKVHLDIPEKAEYFRVLVWSTRSKTKPDFLTNWVDIVPNKTYTLTPDRLIPTVLMSGAGC